MTQLINIFSYSSRWSFLLRSMVLIGFGLLIYGQSLYYGFYFDDENFIVNNQHIRSLQTVDEIWHFLPLTRLVGIYSFAWNYNLGGLDPFGYHVFNFLVHVLATFLVWALAHLLCQLAGKGIKEHHEIPFIMALIFMVHPCQSQAVIYVSQRFESMATLLYLAAIYCYVMARISQEFIRRVIFLILACLASLLAILTKEVAVTIVLMILAVEWIIKPGRLKPGDQQPAKNQKAFVYASIILGSFFFLYLFVRLLNGGMSFFYYEAPSASHDGDIITFNNYLLTQLRVFLSFVRLFFWPIHQNLDYDYPVSTHLFAPPLTLAGLLVIIGLGVFIWKNRLKQPLLCFGLAWVLITFFINLAPRENVIFEHKMYLLSFGFILSCVTSLFSIVHHRTVLRNILVCLVLALSTLTFLRAEVWRDDFTLWQDVIGKSPHKLRPYVNLAKAQGTSGQYEQSIKFLTNILKEDLQNYGAYIARASMHFRLSAYEPSNEDLLKAIALRQSFIDYYKLSIGYSLQGKEDLAFEALNKSIELNRNFTRGFLDRGMYFVKHEKFEEALGDFQTVLTHNPKSIDALVKRAGVWMAMGHYSNALNDLQLAQRFDPHNPVIRQNKAYCLNKMHNL